MMAQIAAAQNVRFWHKADITTAPKHGAAFHRYFQTGAANCN